MKNSSLVAASCLLTLALSATGIGASAASRRYNKAQELEMRGSYTEAIVLYKQDGGEDAMQGVARCYLMQGDYTNAEATYEQLADKTSNLQIKCDYAELLLHIGKFDKLQQLLTTLKRTADTAVSKRINKLHSEYTNAKKWMARPTRHVVSNLSDLNSCYTDFGAFEYAPGKVLFCSDRPSTTADCSSGRRNNTRVQPYVGTMSGDDTLSWKIDFPLSENHSAIDIANVSVGPFCVEPNGQQLLYFSRTMLDGITKKVKIGHETLRLFTPSIGIFTLSRHTNRIRPFEYNRPEEYSVMHPAISADGQTLFFASDMPGGQGGLDIWYCRRKDSIHWDKPVNMGPTINTPGNEEFPTCGVDSVSLYFASDGLQGMGGMDIYRTYQKADKTKSWATPVNMRYPINSTADDYFYATCIVRSSKNTADTLAYFTSNRSGGAGDYDIYSARNVGRRYIEVLDTTPPPPDTALMDALSPDTVAADTLLTVAIQTDAQNKDSIRSSRGDSTVDQDDLRAELVPKSQWYTLTGTVQVDNMLLPLDSVVVCAIDKQSRKVVRKHCEEDGTYSFRLRYGRTYLLWGYTGKYIFPDTMTLSIDSDTMLQPIRMIDRPITDPKAAAQYIRLSGVITDAQTGQPVPQTKICATQNAIRTSECKECREDGRFEFTIRRGEDYTVSGFRGGYQSTSPIRVKAPRDTLLAIVLRRRDTIPQSAAEVLDRAGLVRRTYPREYRIQILANWKETDWEYFENLRSRYPEFAATLYHTRRNGVTRFTYGTFFTAAEARRYLKLFRRIGYTDSFIAVFEYGIQVESIYQSGSRDIIRGSKNRWKQKEFGM